MPFYIYAWIASFSSSIVAITAKLTSKYSIKNPWLFNFIWTALILLFTVPVAVSNHAGLPKDWISVITAGIFLSLFWITYILALNKLDVSVLNPLFSFRVVFAVILGNLFLQEKLSSYQFIFFVIIIVAGMFSTIDEKFNLKSFFRLAIGIGLLSTLFLALNNIFIKVAMAKNDLWTTNLWMAIVNFLVILPTASLFKTDLKKIKLRAILPVAAMGVFQIISNFTVSVAYAVNVGITAVIMQVPFSMIIAFFLSVFVPKLLEKHSLKVYAIRFAAASVMIWGAIQLSR